MLYRDYHKIILDINKISEKITIFAVVYFCLTTLQGGGTICSLWIRSANWCE